ncbi:hypothetical protein ABT186_01620 [Streptomyces sp. NPDC001634]|uniref:hypothetical protein n=1 Tax=Streptomyces sp. NPDC001634 TaxID=3154390 RepID=UPI003323A011
MTADMQALPARQREAAAVEAEQIWAERDRRVAALTLRQAAERTHSPSDRIGDSLAAFLVREQIPVSTDDTYPGWVEHIAALQAANRNARKEGS